MNDGGDREARDPAGVVVGKEFFERWGKAADDTERRFERLNWTPSLVNGAALLALLNIVANADKQDAALSALHHPLALFLLGMVFGGLSVVANVEARHRFSYALHDALDHVSADASGRSATNQAYVLELPPVQETIRKIDRSREIERASKALAYLAIGFFACGSTLFLFEHWSGLKRLDAEPAAVRAEANADRSKSDARTIGHPARPPEHRGPTSARPSSDRPHS